MSFIGKILEQIYDFIFLSLVSFLKNLFRSQPKAPPQFKDHKDPCELEVICWKFRV